MQNSLSNSKAVLKNMVEANSGNDNLGSLDRAGSTKMYLPKEFAPGINDVVIGRGKKCYNHEGNEKLRKIVASRLEEYSAATTKKDKSDILTSVVSQIRSKDPKGGFIKQDMKANLWFDVGDFLAKEKISQTFRDALHDTYKSSTAYKKRRRQEQRTETDLLNPYNVTADQISSEKLLMNANMLPPSNQSVSQMPEISSNSFPPTLRRYDNPFEPTPLIDFPSGNMLQNSNRSVRSNIIASMQRQSNNMKMQQQNKLSNGDNLIELPDELEEIDLAGLVEKETDMLKADFIASSMSDEDRPPFNPKKKTKTAMMA